MLTRTLYDACVQGLNGRILARLAELERPQAWLAAKLDVDRSLVTRWLNGERPIPATRLREIGLVLGKGADWLTSSSVDTEQRAAA